MNTPSHYIINLAILGSCIPKANVAITLGAIIPDIPIFIFYFIAKFIYKLPEKEIWSVAYYQPFWQNIIAMLHSFPLILVGLFIAVACNCKTAVVLCLSMICHSFLDFPFHHDDAHRHFFPVSNYRFISPLSYWDIKHHGNLVALVELLLVLILTPTALNLLNWNLSKGLVIMINILYIIAYYRFYVLF